MVGLRNILSIKASINNGLSKELIESFPDIKPVLRPLVDNEYAASSSIPDPNWLAGFTDGEGCFSVSMCKSRTKIGLAVSLRFILGQHSSDSLILTCIKNKLATP